MSDIATTLPAMPPVSPAMPSNSPATTSNPKRQRKTPAKRKRARTEAELAAITAGVSLGTPKHAISRALAIPRRTVRDIAERIGGPLADQRARIVAKATQIVDEALDITRAGLPDCSALQSATIAGILIQRSQEMTGDSRANNGASQPVAVAQKVEINIGHAGADTLAQAMSLITRVAKPIQTTVSPQIPPEPTVLLSKSENGGD